MRAHQNSDFVISTWGNNLPDHVAVIMDGNGRWASKQGISRLHGHRQGVENVRSMVELCGQLKISYLTLFAFSSENWKRPPREVQWLMRLLSGALGREVQKLHAEGIRLRFIGDVSALPTTIQKKIRSAEQLTAANKSMHLTIALNYGGQWDLTEACKKIAQKTLNEELRVNDISPETIAQHLSTASIPDPDLFIRTGGEQRISNFILWQLAYTELYFTDACWPEFDEVEFKKALKSYSSRVRRFGGIAQESVQADKSHA